MTTSAAQIPMVSYLVLSGDGPPHLVAQRCTSCGATFFDRRNACASCGKLKFETVPLQNTGMLRSYTIVHRAAPNVSAPYVSAVIELDGGGVIKANLVDVDPDPKAIHLGGRVHLTTFVAGTDDDGTEAVAFGYAQDKAQDEQDSR
jgi:uncharacterized protein